MQIELKFIKSSQQRLILIFEEYQCALARKLSVRSIVIF